MTDELPEGDTFDREYVEKLRAEAAGYRTKLRPYEQAFGDFNDSEKSFLFGMLETLNGDPAAGAVQFRDMAKNILAENFYEGLDDFPTPEAPAEDKTTEEKEDQVSLTPEQLAAELDRREKAAQEAAEAKARQAADDAAVQAVYDEITEATGFEMGTPGFKSALALGASIAESGGEPDFKALAPQVRAIHNIPEPEAENVIQSDDLVVEGSGNEHAATAGAGGAGGATEVEKDFVAEAREAGKNPFDAARERLEARLA